MKLAIVLAATAGSMIAAIAMAADPTAAVLFKDDFATLDPGWGQASDLQHVEKGHFVVQPSLNSSFHTFYEGNLFDDIDARVKIASTKA